MMRKVISILTILSLIVANVAMGQARKEEETSTLR